MGPFLGRLSILGSILLCLSSTTAQEPISVLSARAAIDTLRIQQIINLQAIAVDLKQFNLFPQIYTPDVTVNYNNPGVPILHGLDALIDFISKSLRDMASYHAQSTHYVNMTNPARPHATTYSTATFYGKQELIGTRLGR